MNPLPLSLLLILASPILRVHALPSGGDDGHPDGHLGAAWEAIVAASIGLLLFIAVTTILIVTVRRRRRKRDQPKRPDFSYASHLPSKILPSMPYGISRPGPVYQPRDKHGRKASPDRMGPLRESV